MSWSLFRWVWQLDGPLYVGMPPAGSLNRTRLYVPARALWGALTAELSRREAQNGKEPQYQAVGESLQKDYRFTYLYPAQKVDSTWQAWLPNFRNALGLSWAREDQPEQAEVDRRFRRRLLSTRPATSIEASTDTAEDGSLRETECIATRWQNHANRDAGPVAMQGYVLIRTGKEKAKYAPAKCRLDGLEVLFVGGDVRYGLGRLRRVAFERVMPERIFGAPVTLGGNDVLRIKSATTWAHACHSVPLAGGLEVLGGWNRGSIRDLETNTPAWQPGSNSESEIQWTIEPDGLWRPAR